MKDQRFNSLNEKYSLSKKFRKKLVKIKCSNCNGSGSLETYPKTECSLCHDSGWIVEEE